MAPNLGFPYPTPWKPPLPSLPLPWALGDIKGRHSSFLDLNGHTDRHTHTLSCLQTFGNTVFSPKNAFFPTPDLQKVDPSLGASPAPPKLVAQQSAPPPFSSPLTGCPGWTWSCPPAHPFGFCSHTASLLRQLPESTSTVACAGPVHAEGHGWFAGICVHPGRPDATPIPAHRPLTCEACRLQGRGCVDPMPHGPHPARPRGPASFWGICPTCFLDLKT